MRAKSRKGEPRPKIRSQNAVWKIVVASIAFALVLSIIGVLAWMALSGSLGLEPPSNFSAVAGNMEIDLSWNKNDNSDQVLVRCKTTDYPTAVSDGLLVYMGTGTNYVHTDLEYGVTYYYGIWAAKESDSGWVYSDTGAFALGTPYWLSPTNFTVTAGNMQNNLSWDKSSDADWVIIRCKTMGYPTNVTDGILAYQGGATSYTHINLDYGVTYYYGIWSARDSDSGWRYSDLHLLASGTPYWLGPDGEEIHEYVYCGIYQIVGADGGAIELFNNPNAKDPTWEELKQFLWSDETDKIIYDEDSFVCADFAEMLHNSAEEAGIRAAFVSLGLYTEYPWGTVVCIGPNHALNAFYTTDRGLVYIDCTGTEDGDLNADKIVTISVGEEYIPVSIFPNPGYEDEWQSSFYKLIVSDYYYSIQW